MLERALLADCRRCDCQAEGAGRRQRRCCRCHHHDEGPADAIVASFKVAARAYWMTLSDSAGAKPYAAGQAVLNGLATGVQPLAATNHWAVEAGITATAGTEPPCYQPFAAYAP